MVEFKFDVVDGKTRSVVKERQANAMTTLPTTTVMKCLITLILGYTRDMSLASRRVGRGSLLQIQRSTEAPRTRCSSLAIFFN